MKRTLLPTCILALAMPLLAQAPPPEAPIVLKDAEARVVVTDEAAALATLVEAIGKAKQTILIQPHGLNAPRIAEALKEALRRDVKVLVILDKSLRGDRRFGRATLGKAGAEVFTDLYHKAHTFGVVVIDKEVTAIGDLSNLLVVKDRPLSATYRIGWEQHLAHSGRVK